MPADLGPGQLERRPEDRLGQVGRLGQRPLAGDRAERRVADLDRDRPGPDPGRAQPAGHALGHRQQRPLDHLGVAACRRRTCARDRPTWPGRPRGPDPASTPARPLDQRRAVLAEPAHERGPAAAPRGRRSCGRRTRRSAAAVFSPTPHSRPIGSGARKAASSPGGTTTRPSGLRRSEAILATSLVAGDADRHGQPDLRRGPPSLIWRAIVGPSPNSAARPGDVEERLVDRDRLDERREPPQDRHDVAADAPGSAGRRPAGRRRPGSAGTPRAAASPSGRRTRAPRSSAADTTPRASSPPAPPTMTGFRAARGGRAARPPRRRRRGRRAGSSGPVTGSIIALVCDGPLAC